jgi:hypothetical protein
MSRLSRRELERAVEALRSDSAANDAVPMVVPKNALPADHPDRGVTADNVRRTVDGEECDLQLPYHRPRGLFGDGIPLITEAGVVRLWRSLPGEVAEAERELRRARDDPIPDALGGDADA